MGVATIKLLLGLTAECQDQSGKLQIIVKIIDELAYTLGSRRIESFNLETSVFIHVH